MTRSLRSEDEGKRVVRPDGDVIGSVAAVEDDTVYVRPKPGLMKGWGSWICGPRCDGKTFPLGRGVVVDVERETVVVRSERAPAGEQ